MNPTNTTIQQLQNAQTAIASYDFSKCSAQAQIKILGLMVQVLSSYCPDIIINNSADLVAQLNTGWNSVLVTPPPPPPAPPADNTSTGN